MTLGNLHYIVFQQELSVVGSSLFRMPQGFISNIDKGCISLRAPIIWMHPQFLHQNFIVLSDNFMRSIWLDFQYAIIVASVIHNVLKMIQGVEKK